MKLNKANTKKGWTVTEEQTLTSLHKKGLSPKDIAKIMGKTIGAIRSRLFNLDLGNRNLKHWTPEEVTLILEANDNLDIIAKQLGRSVNAIRKKIATLDIKGEWLNDDELELLHLFETGWKTPNIATVLKRSKTSIDIKLVELGVYKRGPWTDDELNDLVDLYWSGVPISEISYSIRRTEKSVSGKLSVLGICNRTTPLDIQKKVDQLVLTTDKSPREIEEELGVPYNVVKYRWYKLKSDQPIINPVNSQSSYGEDSLRNLLEKEYGDAVLPKENSRNWSNGKWEIDIPVILSENLKFAVDVKSKLHADKKNIDNKKRELAENLGWIWISIWFWETPTYSQIKKAFRVVQTIIEERKQSNSEQYDKYNAKINDKEVNYYYNSLVQKPVIDFAPRWLKEDIKMLKKFYSKISIIELQKKLSFPRTIQAIHTMAERHNLTKKRVDFSPQEDEFLKQNYSSCSKEKILAKLKDHSWDTIVGRASKLRVKRDRFYDLTEDNVIINYYPSHPKEEILSLLPKRNWDSVINRAVILGVTRLNYWKEAEDEILRKSYPSFPQDEIIAMLPTRSWDSIVTRAHKLGIFRMNYWTNTEDKLLHKHYPASSQENILSRLPTRSWDAIGARARRLGITRLNYWNDEELQILKAYYSNLSENELLKKLPGRSWVAIKDKANELGLYRINYYTNKEDQLIKSCFLTHSREELLKLLPNRTWKSIAYRAWVFGIRKRSA